MLQKSPEKIRRFRASRSGCSRSSEVSPREHIVERFATDVELRRRRRAKLAITLSPIAALVLGIAAHVVYTWPEAPLDSAPAADRHGGIVGHYFEGKSFEKEVATRLDRTIQFSSAGKVISGAPADNFSARWDGYMFFALEGAYSLCVESDDGNRLHFTGRLLIDDWQVHAAKKSCETVHVRRGWYPIDVEYFEDGRDAKLVLSRGRDPEDTTVVPADFLCCRK